MMIFQSDDENDEREKEQAQEWVQQKQNLFLFSQEHKNNINKRMPRGFCLVKKQQYDRLTYMKKPVMTDIVYQPIKIQRELDLDNPIIKAIDQTWNNKKLEQSKKNTRFALPVSVEGKSRQSEKIKNIIQRFRKLIKNTQVQAYLNKVGLMNPLNQIQLQNKKGMLTIDLFKIRYISVLQTAKNTTFQIQVANQIDQMIQQLICFVEQARKTQFQNNIQTIQKSIDKITRYLTETADGKTQGNWYIRKKKKGQRNDSYTQKQLLYFGELIKKLPPAYLIGIWEIINQRPFTQGQKKVDNINLNQIGNKKIRDIQVYIKGKLSQIYRSRERKKQKIQAKRKQKQQQVKQQQVKQQGQFEQKNEQLEPKNLDNLDDLLNRLQMVKQEKPLDLFVQDDDLEEQVQKINQVKKQNNVVSDELVFEDIGNIQSLNTAKISANKLQSKIKVQNINKNIQNEDLDGIDINNSSDSSMITDQDDSDF